MGLMVIRHKVRNFANWKPAYDARAPARETAGLANGRVYRSCDDPKEVVVLLDMADLGTAKALAADGRHQRFHRPGSRVLCLEIDFSGPPLSMK